MAVACQHTGGCDPWCHNYKPPHYHLEKRTLKRREEAEAVVRDCYEILEMIQESRKRKGVL